MAASPRLLVPPAHGATPGLPARRGGSGCRLLTGSGLCWRYPAAQRSCALCFQKRLWASAGAPCPGMTPPVSELLSEQWVLAMGGSGAPSLRGEPALCFPPLAGHSHDTGSPPKLLQSRGDLSSCPAGCPPPWAALPSPLLQHPFRLIPSSSLLWVTTGEDEFLALVPRSCFLSFVPTPISSARDTEGCCTGQDSSCAPFLGGSCAGKALSLAHVGSSSFSPCLSGSSSCSCPQGWAQPVPVTDHWLSCLKLFLKPMKGKLPLGAAPAAW